MTNNNRKVIIGYRIVVDAMASLQLGKMFNFHKPKVYRSLYGCCICRAKSSSSRFTDSSRYEKDFANCFQVDEHRSGEICNACVLLVKRWKKLPSGSSRNWSHVVDARAGPGSKTSFKFKSKPKKSEQTSQQPGLLRKEKLKKIKKKKLNKSKTAIKRQREPSPALSDDVTVGEECYSDQDCGSQPCSPSVSEASDETMEMADKSEIDRPRRERHKRRVPRHKSPGRSSFLDMTFWKKEEICCGIIYKGPNGEVLIDPKLLHPCQPCQSKHPVTTVNCNVENMETGSTESDGAEMPDLTACHDPPELSLACDERLCDMSLDLIDSSPPRDLRVRVGDAGKLFRPSRSQMNPSALVQSAFDRQQACYLVDACQ